MNYNGWLVSPNIIKRSLAVFGHFVIGYFITAMTLGLFFFIILSIFG